MLILSIKPWVYIEWCQVCRQVVLQLPEHNKLHHEAELPFQPVYGVCVGIQCTWQDCAFMANGETHLARHVKERHQKTEAVKSVGKGLETWKNI